VARDNQGFACHVSHEMVSYEMHHIWPLGSHGPDTPDNKVKVCPNAHSDIHYLMERLFRGKLYDARQYAPVVRWLATRGYEEVTAYAESLAAS